MEVVGVILMELPQLYLNLYILYEITPKVLNVTFHLVLELRKGSNLYHMILMISGRCSAHWIITSTHYEVDGNNNFSKED